MIEASNNKEIQVNWTGFLSQNNSLHESIKLDSKINSYGIILNEICPFSDDNDSAQITQFHVETECKLFFGKNLQWNHTIVRNARAISFLYMANRSSESQARFDKDGVIMLNVTIPKSADGLQGKEAFSLVPGRGITLELTVKNLLLKKTSRIAPILLTFSEQPVADNENFETSLDMDPSGEETLMNMFLARRRKFESNWYSRMLDLLLRLRQSVGRTPAFLQWRRTCQVENSSAPSASRQTHMGPQLRVPKSYPQKYKYSLPFALYGDRFNQNPIAGQEPIGLRLQPIAFGTPKDGFYMETEYVSWLVTIRIFFAMFCPRCNTGKQK
ncbi:unnamed protein product [Dibothriocephalus latus]|uniref:Uncharacterized protein n=1 Tax=Dibothriocephalus latus TaxID=60516 RepID=A0A3P7L622_DIBLA|nr:unnamed protein product [Dibothriocephalus latus]